MASQEICVHTVVNLSDFDGGSMHIPCDESCEGPVEVERAKHSPLRLILGPTRLACGMTVETQQVSEIPEA